MKKFFAIVCLGTLVTFSANAQKKDSKKDADGTTLSVGVEAGLPIGDFKDGYKLGIGGSLKAAFPIIEKGAITANAGYMTFSGKDLGGGVKLSSYNAIPVKAGFRYTLVEALNVEPQIGYTFGSVSGAKASDVSGFTWALNAGYVINKMIDVSARYESISTKGNSTGFIGLRVGYTFSL